MKYNKRLWNICVISVILIIAITFSPLIIAPGKINPSVYGLPFTLWISILTTIALVIFTYIGGLVSPNDEEEGK
jgi:heme A synthase